MGIRLPLQTVLDTTVTDVGVASVNGGIALPFRIPQDTDNIVVKMYPSTVSGGISATLQTTDDGGTTWYDVARTSTASNSGAFNAVGQLPQWIAMATLSQGVNPIVVSNANAGSILGGTIGTAGASTLASRQVSGLPILSLQNRIFLIETGTISSNNTRVVVAVNQQNRP